MLGILFQLLLSWAILFFYKKKNLNALGFYVDLKVYLSAFAFFLIASGLCTLQQFLDIALLNGELELNESFNWSMVATGFWKDFKSVAFEELIFRGALLYVLIDRLSTKKAMIISAIAFGVYHWFSFGIFGQVIPMIIIFGGTGLMGYAFAFSFVKTRSILLPIAIHIGWNITLNTLFSKGPYGDMVFIISEGEAIFDGTWLVSTFSSMYLIPIILIILIHYGLKKQN